MRGGSVRAHCADDVNGQVGAERADQPVEVLVDAERLKSCVGEDCSDWSPELGRKVAADGHQSQGSGLHSGAKGQDDAVIGCADQGPGSRWWSFMVGLLVGCVRRHSRQLWRASDGVDQPPVARPGYASAGLPMRTVRACGPMVNA